MHLFSWIPLDERVGGFVAFCIMGVVGMILKLSSGMDQNDCMTHEHYF